MRRVRRSINSSRPLPRRPISCCWAHVRRARSAIAWLRKSMRAACARNSLARSRCARSKRSVAIRADDMMSETSSDTRCGIGARLRASREQTGMTMLQAAERLHVDSKILEALEAERFESLGAEVFVRGHLRNYAALVDERFTELLQLLEAVSPAAVPDLTRAPRPPRRLDRRKLIKPALIVVGA